MAGVRILLADDHASFRAGFRAALAHIQDVELVGEASDGEEAVVLADQLQPDVVVMDLNMPGRNGIEATRALVEQSPHIAVLVLTMFDDDESVFLAMRAGARGYLVKGASREQILRAVRSVADGDVILSPAVAAHIRQYLASSPRPVTTPEKPLPELTDREREVLDRMAAGRTNAEIAREYGITTKTVRNHASSIFSKLMVADRVQAILRARDAGLGRPTD